MELIDKGSLYAELCKLEALARDRYLDTPSSSPASARYTAQLNERTALKHLVADTAVVDAAPVVRCGKCKHYRDGRCYRDGYKYDKWESGDTSESPKNAPVYYGLKETEFCSHGQHRTPPAE